MGKAMELITGLATAPGAAFVAATALTGNSFTVRDSRKNIRLMGMFDRRQGAGVTRITSALLHDSTIGIQHACGAGVQSAIIPAMQQMLMPQDFLGVQMTGSAVAGDIEHTSMIIVYDDLPGVDARFVPTVFGKGKELFANTITISSGTSGQYTGSVAVNSAQDGFKANTDYALLGYQVSGAACHAVRFSGPDWGNLGVGGPGMIDANATLTTDWFARLGMIPVMNSANRSLTTVDCVQDENGGDPIVTMLWVEL